MKPSNSKAQRIPLWRFPMTASWTHRTPWQSSLTSTPQVVGDLSWITKQMVGESIFGSLNPLSYLCDLSIVMEFSISQLRRGCYRYVVVIWNLCKFGGTAGSFLFSWSTSQLESFWGSECWRPKPLANTICSLKNVNIHFFNSVSFQKLSRTTRDSWWLLWAEMTQILNNNERKMQICTDGNKNRLIYG